MTGTWIVTLRRIAWTEADDDAIPSHELPTKIEYQDIEALDEHTAAEIAMDRASETTGWAIVSCVADATYLAP